MNATLEVDIIENKVHQPIPYSPSIQRKPMPSIRSRQERSPIYQKFSPTSKRTKRSDKKIDEVLETAPVKLTESATKSRRFPETELMPEIETTAKLTDLSDFTLPTALSTPADISRAEGVKSQRQFVAGRGRGGGLGLVNSNGASDGISGDIDFNITKEGRGNAGPAIEWEIRDGLSAIVDQIIPDTKKVDVVFLLDASGSMQYIIDGVLQYADLFIRRLESREIDYALGLVSFVERSSEMDISALGVTLDVNAFKGWLRRIVAHGGGDVPEPSLDAMIAGLGDISFRPETNKVFVLYTDAPFHKKDKQGNDVKAVLNVLISHDITVHVVSIKDPDLQQVASQTGGTWREIPENRRPVPGQGHHQKNSVKFLPTLDADLEFLMHERNKQLGLPPRDVLFALESSAYADDKKHKPWKLAEMIFGMVNCLGYKIEDSPDSPDNNNNSIADVGETIRLNVILKNSVGNIDAENVTADLELENAEGSEAVTILSGQSSYGTIPAGKIVSGSAYKFRIAPDFKGTSLTFRLKIKGLVYSTPYDLGAKIITIYVKQ